MRVIRKLATCILAAALTTGSALAVNGGFPDVEKGQWFFEPVMQAVALDLFSGYPNGKFGPDDSITRAQTVQVLYNYCGRTVSSRSKFSDVAESAWYAPAVAWANSTGLVSGVGNNAFAPDAPLTREQLVTILYAKAGKPKVNPNQILSPYLDYKDVSSWARDAFAWAVKVGVARGTSDNTLSPQGTATRSQMAATMVRYINIVDGKDLPSVGI